MQEDAGFIPGLGRSPRIVNGNSFQYACLENPHGQRSLADCSPWGPKELHTTEQLSVAFHDNTIKEYIITKSKIS